MDKIFLLIARDEPIVGFISMKIFLDLFSIVLSQFAQYQTI